MSSEGSESTAVSPARGRFGWLALLCVAIVSAVLVGGTVYFVTRPVALEEPTRASSKALYQCAMHPTIMQDHPGTCPICGMTLVKVQAPGEAAAGASRSKQGEVESQVAGLAMVNIDPARQQLIGLKTVAVKRGLFGGTWRTFGRIAVDETRVRHVNLKVPAYVERIFVNFVGKSVAKGEPLFSVYSPELFAAQEEYLLALRTQTKLARSKGMADDGDALVTAAARKLALWDVPASEVRRLERTATSMKNLTFYSPIAGVVTRKDVVEGMMLEAGAMPYEIVDLSKVWVLADVYESELRLVQIGMSATLTLKAFPSRAFKGSVSFVDPLLDPSTRTVKVRLVFPNATGELRPEMFGEVLLQGPAHDGLQIPSDAIIESGTKSVVFVSLGEGKFEPREVALGGRDGNDVEVREGLAEGDQVVIGANFLIDSESRLRASLAALAPQADDAATVEHVHEATPAGSEEPERVEHPAAHQHDTARTSPATEQKKVRLRARPPGAEALDQKEHPAHEHDGGPSVPSGAALPASPNADATLPHVDHADHAMHHHGHADHAGH